MTSIFIHILKCKYVLYFDEVVNVVIEVKKKRVFFKYGIFLSFYFIHIVKLVLDNEDYKYM